MNKNIWMILNPYLFCGGRVFVMTLLCVASWSLQAQDVTGTRWYFGHSAENLVFDRNGRDVYLETTQATPFGNVGAVTITDQFTGNLLFYTDGTQVFDASHTLVPTPTPLSGDPSINVPVVTAPLVGSPGQYYLFTNSGAGVPHEVQVSVVDATLTGNGSAQFPLGDLTSVNQATGLNDPSDAMLVIPLGDGETFWLLSQNRSTFEILVTEINNGGIGATIDYDFTDGTAPGFIASHFAFNIDSSQLVMAPQTANRNMWLMDFDAVTGVPTFDRQLLGTGFDDGAGESIYDVEWSPDGSKLYFSRFGGTGDIANIYQIDFNEPTHSVNPILSTSLHRSYGLKRAIDNRIYHLYQETSSSPFSLGRINRPDSTPDSVSYQPLVFDVDFASRQFPAFTPVYNFTFDTLNFTYIDSCFENVTKFFPIVEPVPQNLTWDFGDGGITNTFVPLYTYPTEGGYMVSLTAEINGISQTVTQPVEILTNDVMVDLGNDTTICVDEILILDAGTGDSFVWSTGAVTQTVDIDTAGTYWVEVTSAATGCTDFDDIEVTEYGVAHQLSNQWYFGIQAGIEFTGGAAAITDGNIQMADEGCATISDINGELLFYTNGVTVFNRDHNIMANGDHIGGELASAQSSLILPFNGDQTMYYVFTTESVYGDGEYALRYTVVDMKEDEGRGAVVVKNIKLMENSTERMTASGFNGNDLLLAHEFGNNNFRVYATGADGLSGAIFSPTGEIHSFIDELSATGYMKFSPALNLVAVNIPGTGQVEILDFDAATGEVSNPRLIDTGEANLYGLEFSNAGAKLYLTTSEASSKLIQYDLDSLNSADPVKDISATKFDGYGQGAGYGALQTGPDGIIYMAVNNSRIMGTITGSDREGAGAGFNPSAFDLSGRTSRLGLPNFAQNQSPPLQIPSISVTAGCNGQESTFNGVGRDSFIETYLWRFGDGQSSPDQNTTHTYAAPGVYNVELELSNRCDVDMVLRQTIEVFDIPEPPTVPADAVLCDSPVVLEAWPVDIEAFSYYWSTGDATRQITVSNPSLIDVAIIDNVTGCTSDTLTVFVADARPPVDLGPDLDVCQNDPTIRLDTQIPNGTYEWAVNNGAVSGNNRTFDVATTTLGTFEYTVSVTNSFGCIGRDIVQVVVSPKPGVAVVGNPTTGCGNNDGSIDITFNSSGSFTYQATGPTPFAATNFDGPGSPPSITGRLPGNYTITATNITTGCSSVNGIGIADPGTFNFTASTVGGNCDGTVEIELSSLPPSLNYNYTVLDENGGMATSGTGATATLIIPVTPPLLDPGTYFIMVEDNIAPGCIETEQITIIASPEPHFTFDTVQEICGATGNVLVTDGGDPDVAYTWSTLNGNIVTSPSDGTSVEVDSDGIYTVTALGPGFCSRSEDIEVIFNADPTVDVTISGDPCEGQVVLVANVTNGSGPYIYSWSNGSQAPQNTVTTSGNYTVTVVDQLTSCAVTSSPVDVTIEREFEVVLTLDPDCGNNGNVFLIATTNYTDLGISYEWTNGNGEILTGTDSILTVTASDEYTVTATNETGTCTASASLGVAVVPILEEELILPGRAAFCRMDPTDPTVDLDPGIFNTYEWRLLPDQSVISTDQALNVSTEGTYEVTLFNGFACVTDQVEVVEDCRPVVFAPNAFSPNGINEEFFVFPNEYVDDFEIFIYSRWGELIFYSNNINFRWDGTYRGGLLQLGTYAYILKFSSLLEPALGTVEQYGSVTLIR